MKVKPIFAVAPMIDWTDRHCRYFHRLFSKRIRLYTEMITTGALLHGDAKRWLNFNENEHPIALQLGGSNPKELAQCALLAKQFNYDEINLNVGCPSDRVQSGRFGACLMAEPALVAECISAMNTVVNIPVTVKTRIGIDNHDSYEELVAFISTVAAAGCETFIIHARKAWLKGLSPKENREIPPLQYDVVYQLKRDFPHLTIIINGGITTLELAQKQLNYTDGVMIGRAAYQTPYILADIDQLFFGDSHEIISQEEALEKYIQYIDGQIKQGVALKHMSRHILGLFHGQPAAKMWRRYLSENMHKIGADSGVIRDAAKLAFFPSPASGRRKRY